jgi:hypothetical protein
MVPSPEKDQETRLHVRANKEGETARGREEAQARSVGERGSGEDTARGHLFYYNVANALFLRLCKIEHLFLKLKQPTILISSEVLNGVKSHRKR